MAYALKLEYYEGPLDKLLGLIEEKKLEVGRVSLAEVTGDFLAYVERLRTETSIEASSILIADFLVVASQLLLLKSKSLIPSLELTEEEETELKDLESRLKLYQELKNTKTHIKTLWSELPQMLAREFLMTSGPLFYPPRDLSVIQLKDICARLVLEWEKVVHPVKELRTEMINLKLKIQEILSRLTEKPLKFSALRGGVGRQEIIVLFLAVLHLIKQQLVTVEQSGHFEEMQVVKRVLPQ